MDIKIVKVSRCSVVKIPAIDGSETLGLSLLDTDRNVWVYDMAYPAKDDYVSLVGTHADAVNARKVCCVNFWKGPC